MKYAKIPIDIKMLDNMITRKIIEDAKKDNIDLLSHIQVSILKYLYDNKENIVYQNDIEKKINLRRSTISGILNTMEKKGYIKRKDSKVDARKKEVVLTYDIKEYYKIKKMFMNFEKELVNEIKEEDLDVFIKVINKMKDNLK